MYILTNRRGQVYQFISAQFHLEGKRVDNHVLLEFFEAGDALEADAQLEPAGRKQSPFAQTDVERVDQWAGRLGPGLGQPEGRGILLPFNMERFPLGNLETMDFHGSIRR